MLFQNFRRAAENSSLRPRRVSLYCWCNSFVSPCSFNTICLYFQSKLLIHIIATVSASCHYRFRPASFLDPSKFRQWWLRTLPVPVPAVERRQPDVRASSRRLRDNESIWRSTISVSMCLVLFTEEREGELFVERVVIASGIYKGYWEKWKRQ